VIEVEKADAQKQNLPLHPSLSISSLAQAYHKIPTRPLFSLPAYLSKMEWRFFNGEGVILTFHFWITLTTDDGN
jgi:hypothetical protein